MDKYRVRIRKKNGCLINVEEIKGAMIHPKSSRWLCSGIKALDKDGVVASELDYVTEQEDMAMEVYAKAKRNLDARRYAVSLEMPKQDVEMPQGGERNGERKAVHFGSC